MTYLMARNIGWDKRGNFEIQNSYFQILLVGIHLSLQNSSLKIGYYVYPWKHPSPSTITIPLFAFLVEQFRSLEHGHCIKQLHGIEKISF